jgi:sugar phosphate isomerase/epimerase
LWDPCNEVFANGGKNPFPQGYDWIKDSMIHMHIKDAKKNEGSGEVECTPIGEGVIDYEGHFKQLKEDGYEGYLSLETHWRPKKELSEDLLDRPGGSAFSELGEEATRICVKNWFEIMKRVGGTL